MIYYTMSILKALKDRDFEKLKTFNIEEIKNKSHILNNACICHSELKVIKYLVDNGCDINNQENGDGKTALHEACHSRNDFEVIKYLVESGGNIKLKDNYGMSVLKYACRCKSSLKIIRYLIKKGCEVHSDILNSVCYSRLDIEIIKYLVDELNCDINKRYD